MLRSKSIWNTHGRINDKAFLYKKKKNGIIIESQIGAKVTLYHVPSRSDWVSGRPNQYSSKNWRSDGL